MVGVVVIYLIATIAYGLLLARRNPAGGEEFFEGGRGIGPVVTGFALASQFLGPGQILGVAEEAFKRGISAGWAVMNLGLGFLVVSLGIAARYRREGHYTISGVLSASFGPAVRLPTSLVMGLALSVVSVVVYVAGGSAVSLLTGIPYPLAVVGCGVAVAAGVAGGGMRYLVRANTIHTVASLLGCALVMGYGLTAAGGLTRIEAGLGAQFIDLFALSPAIFGAWFVGNLGAVGSSQTSVQVFGSAASVKDTRTGALIASALLVGAGIMASLAGVAGRLLFPEIQPTLAFPSMLGLMPPALAGLVLAGLVGGLFATASGCTLSVSTLFMKDFCLPYLQPAPERVLLVSRLAAFGAGILPVPIALLQPHLLSVMFLARALRVVLFIVVVSAFYLPWLGRGRATWAIVLGMLATLGWYFAGNPLGVDSVYVALLVPLAILAATDGSHQRSNLHEST